MSPAPASCLYVGRVMHARVRPVRRRFAYRVFSLFIDIDDAAAAARSCTILSHNRFNILCFHDRDHGRRDGTPLRPWVEETLARAGIATKPDAIRLLCFPRLWGFVFNPLSVFYCYAGDGLAAVIYEVNNTFGETHAYVAPIPTHDGDVARHAADKALYVSPLIEMGARYEFALRAPGAALSLGIRETGREGLLLTALQSGRATPLTTWSALGAVLRHPLMTLKVVAAIHVEALRTWLRGARYVPRPVGPSVPVSLATPLSRPISQTEPPHERLPLVEAPYGLAAE